MRDDAAAVLTGGRHQMLDDQRPADRRDQWVTVHIERVVQNGGQAVALGELVAGVNDHGLHGAAVQRPLAYHLHVLAALAEVNCHRHDLAAGLLADPADRHRGVQTAGIRQDDAF